MTVCSHPGRSCVGVLTASARSKKSFCHLERRPCCFLARCKIYTRIRSQYSYDTTEARVSSTGGRTPAQYDRLIEGSRRFHERLLVQLRSRAKRCWHGDRLVWGYAYNTSLLRPPYISTPPYSDRHIGGPPLVQLDESEEAVTGQDVDRSTDILDRYNRPGRRD